LTFDRLNVKLLDLNLNYSVDIQCRHFTDDRKLILGGRCIISDRQFIHVVDFKDLEKTAPEQIFDSTKFLYIPTKPKYEKIKSGIMVFSDFENDILLVSSRYNVKAVTIFFFDLRLVSIFPVKYH
jgi:hypothetical protein